MWITSLDTDTDIEYNRIMKKENEIKQKIIQKMTDNMLEANPGMAEDISNLVSMIVLFNLKYGTKLEPKDIL